MTVFDQNGYPLSPQKATEFFDIVWAIISEAFKYSNENCASIPPELSLRDFFEEKMKERGLEGEERKLVMQIGEMWGAFIGDPWERQSLKYFWLEECLDGGESISLQSILLNHTNSQTENFFVASNHSAILRAVAKTALTKAKIHFNTKVIGINSTAGTPTSPKVSITTEDNQTFVFDELILTVPLGCLKRKSPTFTPQLPSPLVRAIENTSYSSLEKVYLTFPSAFWDSPPSPEGSTPQKQTDTFSPFTHFLSPLYSLPSNPDRWTLELNTLSSPSLFGPHAQPTLLFTIYGPCARHLTSQISSHDQASPEYFEILDAFFKPYYALLPGYKEGSEQCRPRKILATNWQNDDLAGYGSYMNFQVSSANLQKGGAGEEGVKLEEDLRILRWGIPERAIWFAGEHTAPFVGLGTLTGAYWSGEAAAVRVLRVRGLAPAREEEAIKS
jgi:hypothetical protein